MTVYAGRLRAKKKMNVIQKTKLKRWLAALKLLWLTDLGRFLFQFIRNYKKNRDFLIQRKDFISPPAYFQFETTGGVDLEYFYTSGESTADFVSCLFKKYFKSDFLKILDWGCGASRVLRHIHRFLPNAELHGADCNEKLILYGQKKFPGIDFKLNALLPPVAFKSEYFDAIYCISVFTHISDRSAQLWFDELFRILKKGGVVILTLHGDRYKGELLKNELELYEKEGKVFRENYREGKKWFAAYYNPDFKDHFFENFTIADHIASPPVLGFSQDFYILRK